MSNEPIMNKDNQKGILTEFKPHTYEEWHEAAVKLLKGASFEKKLLTKTYEGFTLQPIYRKEDIENINHLHSYPGFTSFVRGNNPSGYKTKPWIISQEIDSSDLHELNKNFIDAIEKGQTEINISINNGEGRPEISLFTVQDMEILFKDINLTKISLFIHGQSDNIALLSLLKTYTEKNDIDITKIKGCIGIDPVSSLTKHGILDYSTEKAFDLMAKSLKWSLKNKLELKTIHVSAINYHESGASATQELGFLMATGVQYINEMQKRGISPSDTVKSMRFSFATGGNFFMEIAKLRAARLLWSGIQENYEFTPQPMFIHSRSSRLNKTIFDPYVNLLRNTTETFSSIIGGADCITISPFDEVIRTSDNFGRRIARNMHFILGEECDLNKITDPAGGSWYIEWLTDKLAEEAWKIFQNVQENDSMLECLKKGIPQEMISKLSVSRKENMSKRKDVLIGTNMFPNASETLLEKNYNTEEVKKKLQDKISSLTDNSNLLNNTDLSNETLIDELSELFSKGLTVVDLNNFLKNEETEKIEKLRELRIAEDFESLKLASLNYELKTGYKPVIFQANIGPSRKYRARADWTTSFFEVGGFRLKNDEDFDSSDEIIELYKDEKFPVIVLVSSDDTYETEVEKLASEIKKINSEAHIIVAGTGGDNTEAWKAAGVDDFVNVKVNNYNMLKSLLEMFGAIS